MKRPLSSNNTSQVPNFARKGVIARFSSLVYNSSIPGNKFGHTQFAKKLNPACNWLILCVFCGKGRPSACTNDVYV